MKGKIIVIEGTDCSGKETQSNLLKDTLERDGYKIYKTQFPRYDTPTGKIIGGPLLGKQTIGESFFDNPVALNSKVASLYYAADRLANVGEINDALKRGEIVLLDRYVESNMAHQGGKLKTEKERNEMFEYFEQLEFELLELPRPDGVIFLHLPYEFSLELRNNRTEVPDKAEENAEHLKNSELAYLEMSRKYAFKTVDCTIDGRIKSIEEIANEVYAKAKEIIDGK